jgi:Uma2 family endonuclease
VRFPDVAWIRKDKLPGGRPYAGHCRAVPDLIVEVVSPNDDAEQLQAKLAEFRAAGVPLLWVVYPGSRQVEVIHDDGTARYLAESDALDGGDVLPGFSCQVADLFA